MVERKGGGVGVLPRSHSLMVVPLHPKPTTRNRSFEFTPCSTPLHPHFHQRIKLQGKEPKPSSLQLQQRRNTTKETTWEKKKIALFASTTLNRGRQFQPIHASAAQPELGPPCSSWIPNIIIQPKRNRRLCETKKTPPGGLAASHLQALSSSRSTAPRQPPMFLHPNPQLDQTAEKRKKQNQKQRNHQDKAPIFCSSTHKHEQKKKPKTEIVRSSSSDINNKTNNTRKIARRCFLGVCTIPLDRTTTSTGKKRKTQNDAPGTQIDNKPNNNKKINQHFYLSPTSLLQQLLVHLVLPTPTTPSSPSTGTEERHHQNKEKEKRTLVRSQNRSSIKTLENSWAAFTAAQ